MRIFIVPDGALLAHQIAAGLVNGQCRVDGEIQLDQLIAHGHPALAAGGCCLLPQTSGLTKAVLLVVVVVVQRIILNHLIIEHGLGQTIPVLHRGKPRARRIEHVPAHHVELRVVHGAAQILLVQLVKRCLHDGRRRAKKLHPLGTLTGDIAHPLARHLRRADGRIGTHAKSGIRNNARCHDAVVVAATDMIQHPVQTVETARLTHRGDAVRQPQLEHILGRDALLVTAQMAVHVDKPRQHIVPAQIHHLITFASLGPVVGINFCPGVADADQASDAIVFNNNIHRPDRWRTVACHHSDTTQNQSRERPVTTIAFRC